MKVYQKKIIEMFGNNKMGPVRALFVSSRYKINSYDNI